jgi:putative transposase
MQRPRLREERITGISKEPETAANIRAVCREHDITEQPFCRSRNKFGGLDVSEARKLREREREKQRVEDRWWWTFRRTLGGRRKNAGERGQLPGFTIPSPNDDRPSHLGRNRTVDEWPAQSTNVRLSFRDRSFLASLGTMPPSKGSGRGTDATFRSISSCRLFR